MELIGAARGRRRRLRRPHGAPAHARPAGAGPRSYASARWYAARIGGARALLAQARLEISPRSYLALSIAGAARVRRRRVPAVARRWRSSASSSARSCRAGTSATSSARRRARPTTTRPRVLRAMVNRAAAGRHLSRPVRRRGRRRPPSLGEGRLRGDPRALLRQRAAGRRPRRGPPPPGGAEPRARLRRAHHRSPGPISPRRPPAEVLGSLGEAARANQSIARQAAAESRGLRLQAAILAIVIPALFLYLSVANTELIGPVMSTPVGRYVLLPAAALLEVTGIVLSWRVTRLEA